MSQPGSWLQRPGGTAAAATTVVGLGGFLFGYDIGIISGVLVMPSFLASFPAVARSPWVTGFVVTAFLIGGMLGALASSWLAEARGRRATLRIGAALFICGGCAQAVAGALPALFVARGVSGLAIGLTASIVPVYNSELAPAESRGAMISFNQYGPLLQRTDHSFGSPLDRCGTYPLFCGRFLDSWRRDGESSEKRANK